MKDFRDKHLLRLVDGSVLGLFRAVFGFFMMLEIAYFLRIEFVKNALILPQVQFSYTYLEFLKPLPEAAMNLLVFVLLIASVCIMLGKFFKPAAITFGIGFLYLLLLDKGHYNNHTYMFCLVSFILAFTNADERFSLKKGSPALVPLWQYQALRFQLFIVYFFGGIAKLNYDWLTCGEPMRFFLQNSGVFESPSQGLLNMFTFGGLAFDLGIGFLLFFKQTRKIAVLLVLFFNFTNAYIFDDIGIFPFIMLSSTIIFFDPEEAWILKLRSWLGMGVKKSSNKEASAAVQSRAVPAVLVALFIFQVLMPFRYALLPNDMDWTAIAQRFSWRMKIQTRNVEEFVIEVVDPIEERKAAVKVNAYVNTMQMRYMAEDPVMVWQFCKAIKSEAIRKGFTNAEVHAKIKVSMNSGPSQYIVDPSVDLSAVSYSPFEVNEWIMPREGRCNQ